MRDATDGRRRARRPSLSGRAAARRAWSGPRFAMDDVAALARVSIAAFWLLFAAASLVADREWAPWASSRLRAFAARGKNGAEDDPRAWTVPHAWFTHFYVVGTCWNAVVAIHALRAASRLATPPADDAALASTLFQIHVARRLLESILVTRHRPGARMHVMGYLVGVLYYLLAPLTLAGTPAVAALVESVAGAATTRSGVVRSALEPRATRRVAVGKPPPRRSISSADTRARRSTRTRSHPRRGGLHRRRFVSRGFRWAPRRRRSATRVRTNTTARSPTSAGRRSAPRRVPRGCREGCRVNGRATRCGRGAAAADGRRRNARRATNEPEPERGTRRRRRRGAVRIPVGGWFDRVVCPHYAAEILLYAGLCAVAGTEGARVNLAMLAAVFGNLALAARRQGSGTRRTCRGTLGDGGR